MTYYTAPGTLLADEASVSLPRTRAMLAAIRRHRDFEVIELRAWENNGAWTEGIVVEVCCDSVPHNNRYDIRFRERLYIIVEEGHDHVPSVDALRHGFPRLAHQYQTLRGSPARLCLYNESFLEILRTWTPERHLHRIQWWLVKSARGELHPADQPLENLFFATGFELVLPWNLKQLRKAETRLAVSKVAERANGATFRLHPRFDDDDGMVLVEMEIAPFVAGAVEFNCATLGDLSDVLASRGSDVLSALKPALRELVGSNGPKPNVETVPTMLLVHAPVCRHDGADPEGVQHFAFLLSQSPLEVGLAAGALVKHEGTIYSSEIELQPQVHDEWRALAISAIDIVPELTAEKARLYNGTVEASPTGVVLGAGTLGSAILNLWGRSAWGQWTVIDRDHVRPHNISRHVAFNAQIGKDKVRVVAELQQLALHGAHDFETVTGDPLADTDGAVASRIAAADVVIDATAAVDYGRLVSQREDWPRHASVYLTPSASAVVSLVEDADRDITLRTLEAQYYRAVATASWGQTHLGLPPGQFWSGASCRDLSAVMSYAQVMGHASTLANQLPSLIASPNASIRIWQRDEHGGVAVHDVPVAEEIEHVSGGISVCWDQGLEAELRQLRQGALPNETGGVLLGYWDFNRGTLVIAAALPAPRDSKATPGGFERGVEQLAEAVKEAGRRTAGMLGYVGEWHSHPRGHGAAPSYDDIVQLVHLAVGMAYDGLPAAQVIVGERTTEVTLSALVDD